jgi:hypothetical protein
MFENNINPPSPPIIKILYYSPVCTTARYFTNMSYHVSFTPQSKEHEVFVSKTYVTSEQIYQLVNKHIERYVECANYQKHIIISEKFLEYVRTFLYNILPIVKYQETELYDKPYGEKKSIVSYLMLDASGQSPTTRPLYYNDVYGIELNTLYLQMDDRIHKYFNLITETIKKTASSYHRSIKKLDSVTYNETAFIQMEPFVYNLPVANTYILFRDKLNETEIENLIMFHLDKTDFIMIDPIKYHQMKKVISESLKYVVQYELGYKSWRNDSPLDKLFHQAYDRIDLYMNTNGIFNITPFLLKSQLDRISNRAIEQENQAQQNHQISNNIKQVPDFISETNLPEPCFISEINASFHSLSLDTSYDASYMSPPSTWNTKEQTLDSSNTPIFTFLQPPIQLSSHIGYNRV